MEVGTILKMDTGGSGLIFYQVSSVYQSSFGIKPICKIRKGFLTIKYNNVVESHIYKSEVGVNYLIASKKEIARIQEVFRETDGSRERRGA